MKLPCFSYSLQVRVKVWKKSFHVIPEHMHVVNKYLRNQDLNWCINSLHTSISELERLQVVHVRRYLMYIWGRFPSIGKSFPDDRDYYLQKSLHTNPIPESRKMDFWPPRIQIGRQCNGTVSNTHKINDDRPATVDTRFFFNDLVRTFWMDGFSRSEPPLSIACC